MANPSIRQLHNDLLEYLIREIAEHELRGWSIPAQLESLYRRLREVVDDE